MIREIIMPQLAMGMSEGTILQWYIAEGGAVERDTPLFSVETEKVVSDIPSSYKGYLHIMVDTGKTVPVENLIAKIAETQEEYRRLLESEGKSAVVAAAAASAKTTSDAVEAQATPEASGATGRIKASGLAKKIAALEGIALSEIRGTGPNSRIVKRDVLQAIETSKLKDSPPVVSAKSVTGMVEKARIPLTGMRGAIARSVTRAMTEGAPVNTFFEVDVTKLVQAHIAMLDREDQLGVRVSLVAIYIRALALACKRVPVVNATIDKDTVTVWENVNVACAVAIAGKNEYESGIEMPVIKNAERKTTLQIAQELKTLVSKARNRELSAAEVSDHTIMLSSTSGMDKPGFWKLSAPILKLPAVVAFQPRTPLKKPVVIDDQVVVRDMLPCGFTFDHRALDGAPVAAFVEELADLLSNPELMLL